ESSAWMLFRWFLPAVPAAPCAVPRWAPASTSAPSRTATSPAPSSTWSWKATTTS
ncbi:MAG: hypothetical protein AVDCRST_MAG70-2534, partial [uncultured Thermomicrobiales bacterium]